VTEIHEGKITTRGRMLRVGAALAAPGFGWLLAFLLLPCVGLVVLAFARRGDYGSVQWVFSLENLRRLAGFGLFGWSPDTLVILERSAVLAVVTTVLCLLLALPLAFWIAGFERRTRGLMMALVMVPSCVNLVIRTYAWMLVLGAHMPPAWLARWAGWIGPEDALYPGHVAVYLGMVSTMLPFAVLPVYASVERLDWHVVEAARDLYAGAWRSFRHAVLPQITPGLLAATILTLVPALGMFVVSDLLGGARTMLLGNLIQQQFGAAADWPFGATVGLFLVAASLVGLAALQRSGRRLLTEKGAP